MTYVGAVRAALAEVGDTERAAQQQAYMKSALPYVGLAWTVVLSVFAGVILASAFSAILVFAQELVPGRVGMVAGLFFGFAFGVSGIASAALGRLADHRGIEFVFHACAFLPLIGLLTAFLPDLRRGRRSAA